MWYLWVVEAILGPTEGIQELQHNLLIQIWIGKYLTVTRPVHALLTLCLKVKDAVIHDWAVRLKSLQVTVTWHKVLWKGKSVLHNSTSQHVSHRLAHHTIILNMLLRTEPLVGILSWAEAVVQVNYRCNNRSLLQLYRRQTPGCLSSHSEKRRSRLRAGMDDCLLLSQQDKHLQEEFGCHLKSVGSFCIKLP